MTLLGKIFTALILLASVVTLTLAIMTVASHKNWQVQAKDNKTKFDALKQSQTLANTQQQELQKAIERERIARAMALQQLQIQVERKKQEVAQKEAQLAAETQKSQRALNDMQSTLARLEELELQLNSLRAENVTLRQDLHTEMTQVVTLTDANQSMEAQLLGMEERYSQVADTLARTTRVLENNGLDQFSDTAHIEPQIEGEISKVSEVVDGFVEIDLGADDGIRPGHQFVVTRGAEYIGKLQIRTTSKNAAVGELIEDLTRGQVREGDRVTTEL